MVTLRTLGRLELLDGERRLRTPRVREAALLVYIVASGERGVPRESLADMFWPGSSLADALRLCQVRKWGTTIGRRCQTSPSQKMKPA